MDGQRAFVRPALRPYLPDLEFVRTVGTGLCVICRGTWGAVKRGARLLLGDAPAKGAGSREELADAAERAGMAVLVAVVAVTSVSWAVVTVHVDLLPYLPWAAGVGALLLIGAACAVAPANTPRKKIVSDGGEAQPETGQQVAAPLDAWIVARTVHQIAAPQGWKGAHLDDVLAHLPGRSKTELLEVLADAQIPVENQLKLTLPGGRQRNRQGVRLTSLPAGLGEAPPAPAPAPPHPAPTPPPEAAPRPPHLTVHRGG